MPVPLRDETIQKKIHHTYRLQFLKDVVLARAIDDSTFNVLNSCIIFNQIDIINHLQNDMHFLGEIIDLFVNTDGSTRAGPQQLAGDSVSRQGEGLDERRRAHAVARAASHPAAAARAVPARGDPAAAAAPSPPPSATATAVPDTQWLFSNLYDTRGLCRSDVVLISVADG